MTTTTTPTALTSAEKSVIRQSLTEYLDLLRDKAAQATYETANYATIQRIARAELALDLNAR